ncbi:MAG: hydroxyacid dehydrogenase [Candidatus Hodarchaeales archaeon]
MKILIADSIDKEAIKLLTSNHEVLEREVTVSELLEEIIDVDAVIVRSRTKITSEVMTLAKKLKVVGRAGIGVDNIDVKTATSIKIPVVNAPRGSTISVAEATVGQIISLARKFSLSDASMKEGLWDKKKFMGNEIFGKTLGLIGSGRIGVEVAKRCQAFGMKIQAYDPYISKDIVKKYEIEILDSFDELLSSSDIISIHAILTNETRNMVSFDQFKLMKPSALIVNFSRGGIINEKDLVQALKEKLIMGAALDVYSSEPLPKDSSLRDKNLNILLTPHIGASTKEAQNRAGIIVAEEVLKVLSNKKPDFCVNSDIYNE